MGNILGSPEKVPTPLDKKFVGCSAENNNTPINETLSYTEFANASKAKEKKCANCDAKFKNVHSSSQKYCSLACDKKGSMVNGLTEAFNSFLQKSGMIPYFVDNNGIVRMLFAKSSNPAYGGSKFMIGKGHVDKGENPMQAGIREAQEELGLKNENIVEGTVKLGWKGMLKGYTDEYELSIFIGEISDPVDFNKPCYEISETKWMTLQEFTASGRDSQRFIVTACAGKNWEITMRYTELKEFKINGLTVQSLEQFVDGDDIGVEDELFDEESMLGEADFGLGAKYRSASDSEMNDYLNRTVFQKKNKLDPYTMPYVHGKIAGKIKIKNAEGLDYDLDKLRQDIMTRPSSILKQNEKLKHSSGEIDQYFNVGLPALKGLAVNEETGDFVIVDTCPGAGICKTMCYAMKGSYVMFPNVSRKQTRTLNYLMNDPEGFEKTLKNEITAAIKKMQKKGISVVIRWHDSGDMFSPEYMELAWNVARAFPNNIFYAYTKVASVANDTSKPENFVINFSAGALSTQSKLVNIDTTKHSHIVPKELFYDLIARKGRSMIKSASGATQFKDAAAFDEFKHRLVDKYNIPYDSIISYDEFSKKKSDGTLGTVPYYRVVVAPGEGDVSATLSQVAGTLLMQH